MTLAEQTKPYTLHVGDCVEVMRGLADCSVDSIVTDPPYELGFMGKSWDASGIAYNVDMWREALRVLKPGGHLLAFSGSRTYHRMTCAIEDAGFEVRDQIMWVYGSGFPKSLDVSKAIDKAAGGERVVVGVEPKDYHADRKADHAGQFDTYMGKGDGSRFREVTAPTTDAARQWEGWGTALKPAHEPICVARKPLVGTTISNVLQFGTGTLNIDACRIPSGLTPALADAIAVDVLAQARRDRAGEPSANRRYANSGGTSFAATPGPRGGSPAGRWPANLIHDGSDEVRAAFPDAAGQQGDLVNHGTTRQSPNGIFGGMRPALDHPARIESDKSAARFFYCAKASRADRNEGIGDPGPQFKRGSTLRDAENLNAIGERKGNHHPTVKPTALMAYLVRLVTPPGGIVLDPFMGSGSTGKAAMREGMRFTGIDMTPEYVEIATARIEHELAQADAASTQPACSPQMDMFAEAS